MSPSVNLEDYIQATEGYSGADLQAVLYNAHLACVHSSISDTKIASDSVDNADTDGQDVQYIALGGSKGAANGISGTVVKSRAEKAQMNKRVRHLFRDLKYS